MLVFLPLLLSALLSYPDELCSILYGPGAATALHVRSADLGNPVDIAYDATAREIVALAGKPDGFHCVAFSLEGQKLADWKLTEGQRPICELHRYRGQLRTILWQRRGGRDDGPIYLASMPEITAEGGVSVADMKDWLAYDRSLAPARVQPIQKLRVILGWEPPRREAGGRAKKLDWVEVNARSLYDHTAFAPDLTALSYSWDMLIVTQLAIRKDNGNYRIEEMRDRIERALGITPGSLTTVDVLTLTISSGFAAYGVSVRANPVLRPYVLAFDVKSSPPKLLWKRTGFLARDLESF